jgi:predicted ATPase/class 3 adenylate cyclase
MSEFPTGTVTMVFTDVEGSTALLSRLGWAYAEALDAHRVALRRAWVAHGGTEMGTEGDGFFVVFPSAPQAVAAVAQAQRDLAAAEWPAGEQVRVRMGVHTGSPVIHDGGYVGMDVHRAARIAAAAHGGQVVLSEATARLVDRAHLPGVELVDLGLHQLKDLAQPERLFQLAGDGLAREFPPLKSLGRATSLPRPATPLVGRDGEVAELATLVTAPGVRLVTLTGPGGSGKTRLAIAVAQESVERFPDGVYFVSLAAVTTVEVMWTRIGEAVDAPPQVRVPPNLFTYLGHRRLLLALDNLEQIPGADAVVAEMLEQAPEVVVIATTRRALNVVGEHQHAVPPLELPTGDSLKQAQASGAVQLFDQHARAVKATFAVTVDNVADVVAVCTRLDGLPLAIELAAARTKLLTPKALLTRLDRALDLAAASGQVPSRQKTLRDTIGWSYDLLTATQQVFFRRLGVFSGGADLQALQVIAADSPDGDGADVLDLVSDLVDVSLVIIGETPDGEPRIRLLETIRAYALDQLDTSGERVLVQQRHAQHYRGVAERLARELVGEHYLAARIGFDTERDNIREALAWTLRPATSSAAVDQEEVRLGMRLCLAAVGYWWHSGAYGEQRWFTQAVQRADGSDSPELARCLTHRGFAVWAGKGDSVRARKCATDALDMMTRLQDTTHRAGPLFLLALIAWDQEDPVTARACFTQAVAAARDTGDSLLTGKGLDGNLMEILHDFAWFEESEHNFDDAKALAEQAVAIARPRRAGLALIASEHRLASALQKMGHNHEAVAQMRSSIPRALQLQDPFFLIMLAEDYASCVAELGDARLAARLLGAAEAARERLGSPAEAWRQKDIDHTLANSRAQLPDQEWDDLDQAGHDTTLEQLLTAAQTPSTGANLSTAR